MNQNIEPKEPKKNITVIVIVGLIVILILLGVWYWLAQKSVVPQEVTPTMPPSPAPAAVQLVPSKEDSVSAINQELNSIDLGNLDQEFQAIDADLNSL